jgi:hypothetical protein
VDAIDIAAAARRRRRATSLVDVAFFGEDDGLALVEARMPIADAARLHAAVNGRLAEADLEVPCGATAGQRRVAALLDLVFGPADAASAVPVGAEISVVVGLPTLLGLDDAPGTIALASGDAHSIDAQAIRSLIDDDRTPVRLRRLVVDPVTGHLLDRGRRSYAVDGALRDFLAARDQTCRFPGCRRRAHVCDVDHADAWQDGGLSDRANLGALCRRHHQLKTHSGWSIEGGTDAGSCVWVSPRGRRHPHSPPPVLTPPPEPTPPPF